MHNKITWRNIEGYNGHYQISTNGNVRSRDRFIAMANGRTRFYRGRTIKFAGKRAGYRFVLLSSGRKRKKHYLHRLVAEAFIPRTDPTLEVNHINGKKSDNRVENLEWVTHAENIAHAHRTGLCSNAGASHPKARIVFNCKTGEVYGTIKEAAIAVGMAYSTLWRMLNGKCRNRTTLAFKCDECEEARREEVSDT